MDYLKITISVQTPPDWLYNALIIQLNEIGYEGFEETGPGIDAYIPAENFNESLLEKLLSVYHNRFKIKWKHEPIRSRNWNEVWEKNYFRPLVIKGQCVVRAPFHTKFPKCLYEIIIEPNMSFGTGNHATTNLMIRFLLEENLNGKTVLDMGSGTGILAILASKKGADQVVAIDISEWSVQSVSENAILNQVTNIKPLLGDASLLGDEKFDLILANILRNVLLDDMEKYASVLRPGGKLIVSGFYTNDLTAIREKAQSLSLTGAGYKTKNNWAACAYVR